jgi:asparagine synthase (glutamine-hydrolysing)
MCGIFGALSLDGHPLDARARLERMAQGLSHRGPDGTRLLASRTLALGATRLRIVDLDRRADQPLASADDALWLACNGEVYNARELRRRFPRYPFVTSGDLESLLPLLAERGAQALREVDGMFALAAWDARRRTLVLARDRAGEKPLFHAEIGGELWFSSEIAPLLEAGASRELDLVALSEYLELGYVLEPRTLFAAVRRVEAGTALIVHGARRTVHRFWAPWRIAADGEAGARSGSAADHAMQLRALLEAAVRKQIVADVPVGTLASGGLDSSLLTVLAARALAPRPLVAFSARFAEPSYDEGRWARRCARLAGARHIEVHCGARELREALWQIGERSAEPIADPAALPTFLIAREAREHVRVVLSGEGADELFGGYPTYLGHALAPRFLALPGAVRRAIEIAIARVPPSRRKVTLEFLLRRFVAAAASPWVERHLEWFGAGLAPAACSSGARYGDVRSEWRVPLIAEYRDRPPLAGAMLLDYVTALRERLLVKCDRATMLNSLEARAPFLDAPLTTFALGLPEREKLRGLTTKWILKRAAEPLLPRAIIRRRKRGLSVPTAALLNGELRADADEWLSEQALRAHGLLDAASIRGQLAEHRAGHANHARTLWPALVLQLWAERWRPTLPGRAPPAASVEADRPMLIE